ncbi:Salivary acidic proline-rich phosphoprotein 1/2 [Elasticomyces elasticus]|nr:Salivary acidic proline-rich phosphoprotein 1/2 [Elasticomyces elasticus]
MATQLGSASPASKVGYSVRFDENTSPSTRIKFLTEGMLLQEMLRDPLLGQYSAVIVDEVHERSVNVDLILGFLRNLVCGGGKKQRKEPLKVVVMSATADTEKLRDYFVKGYEEQQAVGEPSRLDPLANQVENRFTHRISICQVAGRQYPVKTIYLPQPTQDFAESALRSIFQIHCKEPMPGDILVFLTGQDTVESLEKTVLEYADNLTSEYPKMLVLPLFAALPQAAQQRIFEPAPPNMRKVILSTNIAETSVTVPGVRFVVDSGKAKIKQFRSRLGLDSLLIKSISQSAAMQRQGRAGREAAGQCYRLYTEKDFHALEKDNVPEILRCDLSAALLAMRARGVEDVLHFPMLTRPPREAIEKALLRLLRLGALDEHGKISAIGKSIARLPLTPALGRVIVAAASEEFDCLPEVIDVVSCLSVETIFLNINTEDAKENAEAARNELFRRQGDHLTLLSAVQSYASERSDRKLWAQRHFISHRAMQNVMDVRKQLRAQCEQQKLLTTDRIADYSAKPEVSELIAANILKSFLHGFASNTARLMPDGSYRTIVGNQTVAIHPSSVLFGRKTEAIMYTEFVFTSRSYARGVSAVQMDWVSDLLAL